MPRIDAVEIERWKVVGGREPEDRAEERQPGLERPALRHLATETMALALEREVGVRDALRFECRREGFRLVRRDDLVVKPLEDQHRNRDLIEEMDRRAIAIALGH